VISGKMAEQSSTPFGVAGSVGPRMCSVGGSADSNIVIGNFQGWTWGGPMGNLWSCCVRMCEAIELPLGW